MRHDRIPDGLDYELCRYPGSSLRFRGPARALSGAYVAVLGGSEVFGRYVPRPFTALLEQSLRVQVVNLGVQAGGVDVFLHDRAVRAIVAGARATVVQVMGAQNLSNRYYSVHPRRNDRVVRRSPALQALFPTVDFSEFVFTRHMLTSLQDVAPARFAVVRRELQEAWRARMALLLDAIASPTVILDLRTGLACPLGREPPLVAAGMVGALSASAAICRVDVSAAMGEARMAGMRFHEFERPSAERHLTVAAHEAVHAMLHGAVRALL